MTFAAFLLYWAIPICLSVFAAAVVFYLQNFKQVIGPVEASRAQTENAEENRYLFDTSVDLIIVTDADRNITRINDSSRSILGYAPDEMIGRYGGDFLWPADLPKMRTELTAVYKGGGAIRNFDVNLLHKNGQPLLLSWTGVWSDPAQRFFLIGRDMREQRQAAEKLRVLAHFDQLTSLPNRTSFLADVTALQEPNANTVKSASIVFFDLDSFKDVNDTVGQAVADELLRQVASRMLNVAQQSAQVYRIGGDEFALLLRSCRDPLVAANLTDRIQRSLEAKFEIDGKEILIGSSAGVSVSPECGSSAEELIANADLALYEAKIDGGRKYHLFRSSMRAAASARREIEIEINRAAAEDEFVLYFQPQFRLEDGALVGAEALLRWQHPERGLLQPGAFIQALERSPESLRVGKWILRSACEAAASWQAKSLPPVRIGVNLFGTQLHDDGLVHCVREVLLDSRLSARYLEIEITENIALEKNERIVSSLKALREIGIGIAFDDFGTGYASLKCLTQYPLTRIKIDRMFIQSIGLDSMEQVKSVASSLIDMAHNLGLGVIAEGVENAAQVTFLRTKKCAEVQGFLFSKPLTATEFEDLLKSHSDQSTVRRRTG